MKKVSLSFLNNVKIPTRMTLECKLRCQGLANLRCHRFGTGRQNKPLGGDELCSLGAS